MSAQFSAYPITGGGRYRVEPDRTGTRPGTLGVLQHRRGAPINEGHAAVGRLRALADPISMLRTVITDAVNSEVAPVIIFGSIARGQATPDSDIDLAVIASPGGTGAANCRTPRQHPWGTTATS